MAADLARLGQAWARAAGEDLGGLIGAAVRLKGPEIFVAERAALADGEAAVAHTLCKTKDDAGDALYIIVSRPEALTLASALMGFPKERVEDLRAGGLDEESLDAYGEVMNLAVSVLGRIFEEKGQLPSLQREETAEVVGPAENEDWLPGGSYRVARFEIQIEGYSEGGLSIVVPDELAERWFGPCTSKKEATPASIPKRAEVAPEGASATAEQDAVAKAQATGEGEEGAPAESAQPSEALPIALLDPCEEDREQFEGLEETLGRPVLTLDPCSFDPETVQDLAETGAIVLAWDLGGRPGLDVLETLVRDPRTQRIPIAVASAAPTRQMVETALRAGAHTFLHKPYEAEEVARRLLPSD